MSAFILWFSLSMIWTTILMLARNNWTYSQLNKHTAMAYARCMEMVNSGHYDPERIARMYDCMAGYNTIMRRFWIWDITKFVRDPEAYRWVIGGVDVH